MSHGMTCSCRLGGCWVGCWVDWVVVRLTPWFTVNLSNDNVSTDINYTAWEVEVESDEFWYLDS